MAKLLEFVPKAIKLLGTIAQVATTLAAAFGAIHAHHEATPKAVE